MMFNFREISKECMKGLLLFMNALCILTAMLVFAAATADTRVLVQYGEDEAVGSFTGDVFLIIVSVLVITVAVVGCVGVFRENVKILYLYVGFVLILVVLELMVGIFVTVERWGIQIRVTDMLREDFFKNCTSEELPLYEERWDSLQSYFECCGLNGPEDYPSLQKPISLSCCARAYRAPTHAQPQMYRACIVSQSYYNIGCEEQILYFVVSNTDWLIGAASVSFWFEAGGLVMAMWVAKTIKNSVVIYKNTVKY